MDYNELKLKKMTAHKQSPAQAICFFLGLALSLWPILCCRAKAPAEKAQPSDKIMASAENRVILEVGESRFSEDDFLRYVRDTTGSDAEKLTPPSLSRLYDEFVNEKLLLQAARDKGITVDQADKEEYLKGLEGGTLTDQEKASFLASDSDPLTDKVRVDKYMRQVVKDVTVSEDEMRRYYELKKSEFFLPERVAVSQVLLPTEDKAIEVWDKLRGASEEDFRNLARSESEGPEASEGGEMGTFERGQLPAEIEDAIFSLQEGEISPVVKSSYGFHIFRLDKKFAPEWIPFEQAAPSIRVKIVDQKAKAALVRHLGELRESLRWAALPENLPFPYLRNNE